MGLDVNLSKSIVIPTFRDFAQNRAKNFGFQLVASHKEFCWFAAGDDEVIATFRVDGENVITLNVAVTFEGVIALLEMIETYSRLIAALGVHSQVTIKSAWDD